VSAGDAISDLPLRTDQEAVAVHQFFDAAGTLHRTGAEDDQVVAHPLDVCENVRREQHGTLRLSHRDHQLLEKLTPRQREILEAPSARSDRYQNAKEAAKAKALAAV